MNQELAIGLVPHVGQPAHYSETIGGRYGFSRRRRIKEKLHAVGCRDAKRCSSAMRCPNLSIVPMGQPFRRTGIVVYTSRPVDRPAIIRAVKSSAR